MESAQSLCEDASKAPSAAHVAPTPDRPTAHPRACPPATDRTGARFTDHPERPALTAALGRAWARPKRPAGRQHQVVRQSGSPPASNPPASNPPGGGQRWPASCSPASSLAAAQPSVGRAGSARQPGSPPASNPPGGGQRWPAGCSPASSLAAAQPSVGRAGNAKRPGSQPTRQPPATTPGVGQSGRRPGGQRPEARPAVSVQPARQPVTRHAGVLPGSRRPGTGVPESDVAGLGLRVSACFGSPVLGPRRPLGLRRARRVGRKSLPCWCFWWLCW
ncbi:hypothetical protein H4W32_005448 [Actinophytocola algeriensis]|uniref:Uncharacterized protein n=1 Tax=Actinophytocola algeriensis TaxID=1768010 RepID=A0A7W7VJ02_9PSEU|nr:hypothetical protein [Actinophytocola algeriensis]MBE1477406.1 hypothetical protein [Actinophytocola algeriensis]